MSHVPNETKDIDKCTRKTNSLDVFLEVGPEVNGLQLNVLPQLLEEEHGLSQLQRVVDLLITCGVCV